MIGVLEERARDTALRNLPQVINASGILNRRIPEHGILLARLWSRYPLRLSALPGSQLSPAMTSSTAAQWMELLTWPAVSKSAARSGQGRPPTRPWPASGPAGAGQSRGAFSPPGAGRRAIGSQPYGIVMRRIGADDHGDAAQQPEVRLIQLRSSVGHSARQAPSPLAAGIMAAAGRLAMA
jgi:hypothetical protein